MERLNNIPEGHALNPCTVHPRKNPSAPWLCTPCSKPAWPASTGICGHEGDWLRAGELDRTVGKLPALGGSGPLKGWAGTEVRESPGHCSLGFSLGKKKVGKKIDCSLLQTQGLQIILKISFLWENLYTN